MLNAHATNKESLRKRELSFLAKWFSEPIWPLTKSQIGLTFFLSRARADVADSMCDKKNGLHLYEDDLKCVSLHDEEAQR